MPDLEWPEWADGLSVHAIRELHDAAAELISAGPCCEACRARFDRLRAAVTAMEQEVS